MSEESREDKFDRLWKRADEIIARFDKMFSSFPEPTDFSGFFNRTRTYFDTNTEEEEFEPANDPMEYKLVKANGGFDSKEAIEEWLNEFGADGWDLNCFEFGYAIFSRFVEDEDEAEESGPEDV